ncbi:MAG: tectonin domain-containing protein [Planctomycetota bacterium]
MRVGEMGLVWGLNDAGGIFVREGVTEGGLAGTSWNRVPGKLAQVSVGEGSAWGVNPSGGVYVREGVSPGATAGTAWTRIPGTLARVSVGGTGLVWGLNQNGGIFVREGVTEADPGGTGWTRINGDLATADVGYVSGWGLNDAGGVWCRTGVCPAQPCGTAWNRVPGRLACVSAGLAEETGTLSVTSKSSTGPVAGSFRSGPVGRDAHHGVLVLGIERLAAHSAVSDRAFGISKVDEPLLRAPFPEGI